LRFGQNGSGHAVILAAEKFLRAAFPSFFQQTEDFARWHRFCISDFSKMKKIRDKSILIIDDDTGILRALDKVLTSAGAIVTRAQNAGDAVEILTARKEKFDLVITDLRMPFVTGLTVVHAIHEIFPELPVIVLTAFGSADVKAECFNQGAAAFLEKPLDASELLAVVERVFALQKTGSGSAGAGRDEKSDFIDEKIETEKNRLNARHLMSGRQNGGLRTGAGAGRKEKGTNLWIPTTILSPPALPPAPIKPPPPSSSD
jgi:two-component system, OmpR family, response regulator CpxR